MKTSLGFDDLLVTGASWLLAGCATWAGLILAAAVLEASTGGRLRATAWVACPSGLRRALLTALGVALVTGPTVGSSAGSAPGSTGTGVSGPRAASSRQALPVPARPLGAARSGSPRLVVRPGDVLWRLAEARLPESAAAGEVADLVGRLHQRNREVIGPDPDLIRPGQRLVVPSLHAHETSRHQSGRHPEENP
ncbi:MAG: hypothetical protein JWR85_2359 [Marmoricola sp.]|nr:hypothetical protein [Marmoricola sp.]